MPLRSACGGRICMHWWGSRRGRQALEERDVQFRCCWPPAPCHAAMMSFHVRRRSRHGRTLGRVHLQALDQPPPRACSVRRKTLQYLLTQQPCLRQRHDADGRCGQRAGASGGVLRVGPYSERCARGMQRRATNAKCAQLKRIQSGQCLSANAPAGRSKLQRLSPHIEHTFAFMDKSSTSNMNTRCF